MKKNQITNSIGGSITATKTNSIPTFIPSNASGVVIQSNGASVNDDDQYSTQGSGIGVNAPTVYDDTILENLRFNLDAIVKLALVTMNNGRDYRPPSLPSYAASNIQYYIVGGKALELSLNPEAVNKLINDWRKKSNYIQLPHILEKYADKNIGPLIKSSDWDIHIYLDNINTEISLLENHNILDSWSDVFLEKLRQKFSIFSTDLSRILNLMGYEFEKGADDQIIGFYVLKRLSLDKNIPLRKVYINIVNSTDKSQKRKVTISDIMLDVRNNKIGTDVPKSDIEIKFPKSTLINVTKNIGSDEYLHVCSPADLFKEAYKMAKQKTIKQEKYIDRFVMLYHFIINDLLTIQSYIPYNQTGYHDYCKSVIDTISTDSTIDDIFSKCPMKIQRNNSETITPAGTSNELINFSNLNAFSIVVDTAQKINTQSLYDKFTRQHYDKVLKSQQHFLCINTTTHVNDRIDPDVVTNHYNRLRTMDDNRNIKGYSGGPGMTFGTEIKNAIFNDIGLLDNYSTSFHGKNLRTVANSIYNSINNISNKTDDIKTVKNSKDFTVYNGGGYFYVGNIPNYDFTSINEGDILMTQFFTSTSIALQTSVNWGHCPCCLFKIKVKKDSTYAILMDYSDVPQESEILLPFGGQLIVKDVKYQYFTQSSYLTKGNLVIMRTMIDLDYIGPPSNCTDIDTFVKLYRFRYNVVPENEKAKTLQSVIPTAVSSVVPTVVPTAVITPAVVPTRTRTRTVTTKLIEFEPQIVIDDTPTMIDFAEDYRVDKFQNVATEEQDYIEYYNTVPQKIRTKGKLDKDGKKTGRWISWFKNGKKKEDCYYVGNLKTGKYTSFYDNGHEESSGYYLNGEKDDIWSEWYDNNVLKSTGRYTNGIRTGSWTVWNADGINMLLQGDYDMVGKKVGIWTKWFDSGVKESEGNYIDDVKNGNWTKWYYNGRVQEEGAYQNGREIRNWRFWKIDGTLDYDVDYSQSGGTSRKNYKLNRKI